MADITSESFPTEYERAPEYRRPYGGIVAVMDKIFRQGMTQLEATPDTPSTES